MAEINGTGWRIALVSIPKRVSEVLWPPSTFLRGMIRSVSIPKRVSEVLWQRFAYE